MLENAKSKWAYFGNSQSITNRLLLGDDLHGMRHVKS